MYIYMCIYQSTSICILALNAEEFEIVASAAQCKAIL